MVRILISSILVLFCAVAQAGRRPFTWTWDVETLKAGEIELEEWLWVKRMQTLHTGWIWFSPIVGVTNQLELAFPWEVQSSSQSMVLANMTFELRYAWQDPLKESLFNMLSRVFVTQNFNDSRDPRNSSLNKSSIFYGTNLVFSLGPPSGTHTSLDIGYTTDDGGLEIPASFASVGLGFAYGLSRSVRIGAEYFAEKGLTGAKRNLDNRMAGPTFSISKGRFWLTMGCLTGLRQDTDVNFMPRLLFGAAL